MFGQITFGDRIRRIAEENGRREYGRYRYSKLSSEEKDRHAELSDRIHELHDAREILIRDKKFEEAKVNLEEEGRLWDEMIDLMTGEKKGA